MSSIVIVGSALSGNKGAAAMLESSIATLEQRLPGAQFTLLSMYPAEDKALNSYPNLRIIPAKPAQLGVIINSLALLYRLLPPLRKTLRSRSAAIDALAGADALLDQGGITFTDGREKFLLYNVASILPAMNIGIPVFKCAQAIGPFRGRINRFVSRVYLPRVHTIVTRGAITQSFADGLGLTNTFPGADYALSLELAGDEQASVEHILAASALNNGRQVVGLSPSVVMQRKIETRGGDYRSEMANFARYLIDAGWSVMLVPHSARTNTDKTHNNDLPLCREIAEAVGSDDNLVFLDEELTSQQLRYLIGTCQLFVTSRFHAMVSGLAMGVPTLVVGWSHKYEEVLDMFSLSEWAFGSEELSQDYLRERFESLAEQQTEVRGKLAGHLPGVKRTSLAQADLIAELVRQPR